MVWVGGGWVGFKGGVGGGFKGEVLSIGRV